jgi:hypothetical protein
MGKPKNTRSRPDASEQRRIKELQEQMERHREAGRDQRANRLMDQIQNLAAEAYEKRRDAGYKRGGKVNRSNMNMQMTRGDKMDDENKNASKKKMKRGGMTDEKKDTKKMKRGGMTKKKMKRGGEVKGAGCATKGVKKAKIR